MKPCGIGRNSCPCSDGGMFANKSAQAPLPDGRSSNGALNLATPVDVFLESILFQVNDDPFERLSHSIES